MLRNKCFGRILLFFFGILCTGMISSVNVFGASLEDYDLESLDSYVEESLYSYDFKSLTQELMSGELEGNGIIQKCIHYFVQEIQGSVKNISLVLGAILLGAVFKNMTEILNHTSVIKSGALITYLAVMTLLFTMFEHGFNEVVRTMEQVKEFLYALIPVFFCGVSFTRGSFSGTLLYQWTGLCISVMQAAMVYILLPLVNYYVILAMVNGAMEEGRFETLCRWIKKLIQYSNRTMMGVILGMTSIKSMTIPLVDTAKNTMIKKSLSMVPGIGNGVESVAETIAGTGNLIKNSIGAAGLLVVVFIMLYPAIRLVVMNLVFHFLGAVAEPVAQKNIIRGIMAMSEGLGLLQYLMITAGMVLMISIGIICIVTGV
ncbi:MAG: stage III sporulation protein AE [Lachnospiraceae bacterium]